MARKKQSARHSATYQTRIRAYNGVSRDGGDEALSDYASIFGQGASKLFAAHRAGNSLTALKPDFCANWQLTSRMYNAMRVTVEGMVDSVAELRKLRMDDLRIAIAVTNQEIAEAEEKGLKNKAHNKRRRLARLENLLARLQADADAGIVRVCFGSRKLWRKQFHLEDNGYADHKQWKTEWTTARSSQFFVLGSKDENAGCVGCVATVQDDGSVNLRLRLPETLIARYGKYLVITGVRFAYGHEAVLAALESNAEYARVKAEQGVKAAQASGYGQAISYRFVRDKKSWRVFATTEPLGAEVVTDGTRGAVGVDLNVDHLAVTEVDASGNYVSTFRVPLVTYGKSRWQSEALIGDAVAEVVEFARSLGKPIVLENLDFRRKKAALERESPGYSRMLSSFAYGRALTYFKSRGYRNGVEVREVNPAFSSVIGRVKFMKRYGLTVHQAAAMVLARRYLGCSEGIPSWRVCRADNGVRVGFRVPARKRARHVWTLWGAILGNLGPAFVAQHGQGEARASPYPVRAASRGRPAALAGAETSTVFPGAVPGRESS